VRHTPIDSAKLGYPRRVDVVWSKLLTIRSRGLHLLDVLLVTAEIAAAGGAWHTPSGDANSLSILNFLGTLAINIPETGARRLDKELLIVLSL